MMQATPAIRRRFAKPLVIVLMVDIPPFKKEWNRMKEKSGSPVAPESLSMLLAARKNP
jgi:hypothetical protein